jgi:hypothetical protein
LKPVHIILLSILALLSFIAEFVFLAGESHGHWWDAIPAFYALWGFLSCIVIIIGSKWLGKAFIQQKEDFYDRP